MRLMFKYHTRILFEIYCGEFSEKQIEIISKWKLNFLLSSIWVTQFTPKGKLTPKRKVTQKNKKPTPEMSGYEIIVNIQRYNPPMMKQTQKKNYAKVKTQNWITWKFCRKSLPIFIMSMLCILRCGALPVDWK